MAPLRILIATLGCLALAACELGTGAGDRSPVGTYQLVSVDGQPLPATVLAAEILSGSATLRDDKTYTFTSTVRIEDVFTGDTSTETNTETGTWLYNGGGSIAFMEDGGENVIASYDGDSIDVVAGIVTLRFER